MALDEQLRARVVASRSAQGLPPTVEDPTVLRRVADILNVADGEPTAGLPTRRFSAARARAAREAAGLSREAVAVAVDKSYSTIASYESGQATPSLNVFFALARVYGVAVDALLEGDGTKSQAPSG